MPEATLDLPKSEPKYYHSERLEVCSVARAAADAPADAAPAEPEIWAVLSSETPVDTYFGTEILSHEKSAIDMGLARNGISMYVEHGGWPYRALPDPGLHIGSVTNIELRGDRKLWGKLNFSQHPLAQQWKQSALDGTALYGSVKAMTSRRKVVGPPKELGDPRQELVTRWRPEEFSIVGIPADASSRIVARSANPDHPVEYESDTPATQEEPTMPKPEATPADPAVTAAPTAGDPAPTPVARSAASVVAEPAASASDILALCESHNVPIARAKGFLDKGLSLGAVKTALFDELSGGSNGRGLRQPAAEVDLSGLKASERKKYSVRRALLGILRASEGTGRFEGLEAEVHEEISRSAPQGSDGFWLPIELETPDEKAERRERIARAMGTNVLGAGAELVFDQPRDMLDILRNRMVLQMLGAEVWSGLTGNVPVPVQTGDPTAYFISENPASAVTQSQLSFVTRTLSAKEAVAQVVTSRRLLEVGSFGVENRLRTSLVAKHAVFGDYQGLHGSGVGGECTGIANVTGIGSVSVGGAPTFAKIVDIETAALDSNVYAPSMAYVTTPPMAGKLKQTPVISGAAAGMIWTGRGIDGEMNGYRAAATKQVRRDLGGSADEHGIFFGDFSQCVFGYWGALQVLVDSTSSAVAGKGQIVFTTNMLFDFLCLRPEAFAFGSGAKLS